MPAASPGNYQALGMHLESRLVLPELMPASAVQHLLQPATYCITVTTVESPRFPGRLMLRPTFCTVVPAIASRNGCTPP